jgi:MFS family permease
VTLRLLALTLVHFAVDFCGGLVVPLPEPTLVRHLGVDLPRVALLLGGAALIVNVVQPTSGWLLPKQGLPILLALAPLAAALTACIGLTHSYWMVALMLAVASVGIGIVHPEAALAAHSVSGRGKGFGVSFFMSGGYFGFSCGSLAAGWWVVHGNQGLARFWLLALPGILACAMVLLCGLHRLKGHMEEDQPGDGGRLSFWPVFLLAIFTAVNMCLFVRFIPIYLVRMFPGQQGQLWGGATVFATGVTGAIGAWLWGHLSDRLGRGRVIVATQAVAALLLWPFLHLPSPGWAPVWGLALGLTMGSVFPLCVVLARQSHGLPQRLRLGLAIGGAWGLGEIAFMAAGKFLGRYPPDAAKPVFAVLSLCWVLLAATAALAVVVARKERELSL